MKTIIFDFDGVIVDTFDIAFEVNKLTRPSLNKESYREKFNGNINTAQFSEPETREIDFFHEYRKRLEKIKINPDTKKSIISLSKNFRLFVISSTVSLVIGNFLEKNNLLKYFIEILGLDVDPSKVEKFNIIFDKYNISPQETIFITDTSGDVLEAREAKINFIVGMLGGYQNENSLKKSKPDIIVKNFIDFSKVIQKHEKC